VYPKPQVNVFSDVGPSCPQQVICRRLATTPFHGCICNSKTSVTNTGSIRETASPLYCINQQEAFEKCWAHSLLRAVLRCHSPGVATAATVARRLRIDVHHHDDNNNDNAWQRGPLWPHRMGPSLANTVVFSHYYYKMVTWVRCRFAVSPHSSTL